MSLNVSTLFSFRSPCTLGFLVDKKVRNEPRKCWQMSVNGSEHCSKLLRVESTGITDWLDERFLWQHLISLTYKRRNSDIGRSLKINLWLVSVNSSHFVVDLETSIKNFSFCTNFYKTLKRISVVLVQILFCKIESFWSLYRCLDKWTFLI